MAKSASGSKSKTTTNGKEALSICPTDGNGWCSYPFSPAQIAKRLKAKQLENQKKSEAEAGKKSAKKTGKEVSS